MRATQQDGRGTVPFTKPTTNRSSQFDQRKGLGFAVPGVDLLIGGHQGHLQDQRRGDDQPIGRIPVKIPQPAAADADLSGQRFQLHRRFKISGHPRIDIGLQLQPTLGRLIEIPENRDSTRGRGTRRLTGPKTHMFPPFI